MFSFCLAKSLIVRVITLLLSTNIVRFIFLWLRANTLFVRYFITWIARLVTFLMREIPLLDRNFIRFFDVQFCSCYHFFLPFKVLHIYLLATLFVFIIFEYSPPFFVRLKTISWSLVNLFPSFDFLLFGNSQCSCILFYSFYHGFQLFLENCHILLVLHRFYLLFYDVKLITGVLQLTHQGIHLPSCFLELVSQHFVLDLFVFQHLRLQ